MHFYNEIKQIADRQEVELYVDMDGVIASYDAGKPLKFAEKRPLTENINKLEKIIEIENVELHILSVCRRDYQIKEKNDWLDKYAPFFKKENRIIISKESNKEFSSSDLKVNYLKSINTNKKIVLVDDDNQVLKNVMNQIKSIIVFQDSELID